MKRSSRRYSLRNQVEMVMKASDNRQSFPMFFPPGSKTLYSLLKDQLLHWADLGPIVGLSRR